MSDKIIWTGIEISAEGGQHEFLGGYGPTYFVMPPGAGDVYIDAFISCNHGDDIDRIHETVFKVNITSVTPPNDEISFTTKNDENDIHCTADIKPDHLDDAYNSQIEWEMDDNPNDNYDSGNPNDPQRGDDVNLEITIPPVPRAPNGRGHPLSYRIRTMLTIQGKTDISEPEYITQDERDQCRQEYIDMKKDRIPARNEFSNGGGSAHYSFNDLNYGHYNWAIVTQGLYDGLEATGANLGWYENLSSGYRNPIHNAEVGGKSESRHIYGRAADIDGDTEEENNEIYEAAKLTNPIEILREPNDNDPRWIHVAW